MSKYVAGVPLVHLSFIEEYFQQQGIALPIMRTDLDGWHVFGGESLTKHNPVDVTWAALVHGIPSWQVVFNRNWEAPFAELRWFDNREVHLFAQSHLPTPESYQTKEVYAYKLGMKFHPIEAVNAAAACMAYHIENGLGDQVQLGREYKLWRMLRGD